VLPNGTWMTAAVARTTAPCLIPGILLFQRKLVELHQRTSASDGETTEFDESGWNLMPNGEVLMVNVYLGQYGSGTADGYSIYNPSTNTWTQYSSTAVQLWDSVAGIPARPAMSLADHANAQRNFFLPRRQRVRSRQHRNLQLEHQHVDRSRDVPQQNAANDAPGATEINGNAIVVTIPIPIHFVTPHDYEWNGTT